MRKTRGLNGQFRVQLFAKSETRNYATPFRVAEIGSGHTKEYPKPQRSDTQGMNANKKKLTHEDSFIPLCRCFDGFRGCDREANLYKEA